MSQIMEDPRFEIAARLEREVLAPLKQTLIGKEEIIDLLGIGLVGRENLFLHGPPGTAKSAIVRELSRRIEGNVFDYLLTRFTEPNELFGPFDIRKLREGELVTNTAGMFPEATLVFLDELLNANSAILNSLLLALNERVFRRGAETRTLPTLMVIGASNHLPEDEALGALFDRFLIRVSCVNVAHEQLALVLDAGWKLAQTEQQTVDTTLTSEQIRELQSLLYEVDLEPIKTTYLELIHRFRHAGFDVSDRRAVKYQKLVAASAVMCQRAVAVPSDLWVLQYTWDTVEQQLILQTLVHEAIATANQSEEDGEVVHHPRSRASSEIDAEALARDFDLLLDKLETAAVVRDVPFYKDQLSLLSQRSQWVLVESQRSALQQKIDLAWQKIEALA